MNYKRMQKHDNNNSITVLHLGDNSTSKDYYSNQTLLTNMTNFVVLYAFHKINPIIMRRLCHLCEMNPKTTIVPFLGLRPRIVLPILIDNKRTKGLNLFFTKSKRFFEFSRNFNRKIRSPLPKKEIDLLHKTLHKKDLTLYCDFTPLGYFHQDLAILEWFSDQGRKIDFDFLIFYEYDMLTTKRISEIYGKYTSYDASFANYSKSSPAWYWHKRPLGSLKSMRKWLEKHGQDLTIYTGLFAGHIVSREILVELEKMKLPFAFCEGRWPTVITQLGYSCKDLDFPMMGYGSPKPLSIIRRNLDLGIFHPVGEDVDLESIGVRTINRKID